MVYYHDDKEFGRILVYTRKGMRTVRTMVKNGTIEIHIPDSAPYDYIIGHIDKYRDKLRQMLAEGNVKRLRYKVGQEISMLGGWIVVIVTQNKYADGVTMAFDGSRRARLGIPSSMNLEDSRSNGLISKGLKLIAKRVATVELIPFAEKVAAEKGLKPLRFVMGSGMRKLGHCTPKGEIQLSYNLMFLPEHLVRFVVLHELAHLAHLDHSPQFHALLNTYCDGKEKALDAELKHFAWPVIRG